MRMCSSPLSRQKNCDGGAMHVGECRAAPAAICVRAGTSANASCTRRGPASQNSCAKLGRSAAGWCTMRWMASASSLVIRAKKARPMLQQLLAQRASGSTREQAVRQLLLALGADRGGEQRLLVAEMAVDGELGHAGLGGDLVHAHAVEAVGREHALGRIEDRGALAQVLGPAGAGWAWRAAWGRDRRACACDMTNTRLIGLLNILYRQVH